MMKTKRLGHKRTRRMPLDAGREELEHERHREVLNTENPKEILFQSNARATPRN